MTKEELWNQINSDLYRYAKVINKKLYLKNILINRQFRYSVLMRKTLFYKANNNILFYVYRILLRFYSGKYNIQIPYETQIGKGLLICHWGGILINKNSIIGNNVTLQSGITIGAEFRGERRGTPIIGNDVYIAPNAVIVGNIKIGDNVLIGANAFVNFYVPSNSIVIGNPARIIQNKTNATEGYIFNKYEEYNY